MQDVDLSSRKVVVTGAGGRLGQRVVEGFARQGATIAAVVMNAQEGNAVPLPAQGRHRTFIADVTDERAVQGCFGKIRDHLGHVDVLVHTVGGWDGRPFLQTSHEAWDRLVRVNLTSTFLCFREAARLMQGRPGRLIGIASGQGADGGRPEQAAYSAAKAGVVRLVESVAAEFEGSGLTAHAIAPSVLLFDEASKTPGVPASQVVDLCLYLCTSAGDALNGATLRAYGAARNA